MFVVGWFGAVLVVFVFGVWVGFRLVVWVGFGWFGWFGWFWFFDLVVFVFGGGCGLFVIWLCFWCGVDFWILY